MHLQAFSVLLVQGCIPIVLTELHVVVERPISIVLKSHFQARLEPLRVG